MKMKDGNMTGEEQKWRGKIKYPASLRRIFGLLRIPRPHRERIAADRVESAIAEVIAEGKDVTYDLKLDPATAVGTSQVADAVITKLKR